MPSKGMVLQTLGKSSCYKSTSASPAKSSSVTDFPNQLSNPLSERQLENDEDHGKNFLSDRHLLFLSAAISASVASALYNPLDCLRVRWQVQKSSQVATSAAETAAPDTIVRFGAQIIRTEGLVNGLWKPGVGANAMGMGLSAAFRFGYYESIRDFFVGALPSSSHDVGGSKGGGSMVLAGLTCGVIGSVLTTPFYLLKTIIQAEKGPMGPNGKYLSGSRAGKRAYVQNFRGGVIRLTRDRGLTSLWRGCLPLSVRGALFSAGQMAGYDGSKTYCRRHGIADDGAMLHVFSSLVAAAGATLLSTPADFVMSRYFSATAKPNTGIKISCVIKDVYAESGFFGFWRGSSVFFTRLTPVMLTYSTLYEQLRYQFGLGYLT